MLRGADHEGIRLCFVVLTTKADEGDESAFVAAAPKADEGDESAFSRTAAVGAPG